MHTWVGGAVCGLVLGVASPSFAGTSEQVPLGARAIALAGAYSAAADDGTALFWNPAGLAGIGHQELTVTHANLFDSGIKDDFAAFALPLSRNRTLAFDWYHSGFADNELDFGENRFDLAYAVKLPGPFSIGATAKYLRRDTNLDGATVPQAQGWGLGTDLGLLATPSEGWRFALVGQDLTSTRMNYSDGSSSVVFPRNIRAASAHSFGRWGLCTLDVDDRVHLGLEASPLNNVAVRGGAQRDLDGEESPTYSVGAGFKVAFIRTDYAYEIHPVLPATHHMSAAFEFNLNPSQIRIDRVEAQNLFASIYKSYAQEPAVVVSLTNLQDHALDVEMSVGIPGFTSKPVETPLHLAANATQQIPIALNVDQRVMRQGGDRSLHVQVTASYQSKRFPRTDRSVAKCIGYGPGTISWDGGAAPAAAFVTTQDPVVSNFALNASRVALADHSFLFNLPNLDRAAAAFDALQVLGISYQHDPIRPLPGQSIDTILYPRETFEKRIGDCDDTSVLVAALLGSLGVNSQFVVRRSPGHVFLLFDSGLSDVEHENLILPDDKYVRLGGRTWIPLETTAVGEGFASAWTRGALAYNEGHQKGVLSSPVDIGAAQARYLPAEPVHGALSAPLIEEPRLAKRFKEDVETFRQWRDAYLKSR